MPHGGRMKSTLSCVDQPLDRAHSSSELERSSYSIDLDRHALAAEHDAAGVVHVLHPELIVRERGDGGAARVRAGLGDRPADLDLVLRLAGAVASAAAANAASAPSVSRFMASPCLLAFPGSFFAFANKSLL